MDGGGGRICPPYFIVETIEKVLRICTVFLSGSFEGKVSIREFQLSSVGGGGGYMCPLID